MSMNRNEERCGQPGAGNTLQMAETLRSTSQTPVEAPAATEENRMPLFWRVFGGTVLSIAALGCVTAYQQLTGGINEVRSDLNHTSENLRKEVGQVCATQAELTRKDEFNTRMKSVWDNLKDLRAESGAVAALRERCGVLEQQLKAGDDERKELSRELQRLREARAADEERRELLRELQALRERLAAMEGRQTNGPAVKPAVHREN